MPEGQAIKEKGSELGWAGAMIHYAITYRGVAPPTMTTDDLEEVITEKGMERRSSKNYGHFGTFTSRVYQLPQAELMLARLTPQAARRLERELQEPTNFGMAKSFVLLGQEAGFDMESPEGMRAWVKAYNATVAPTLAATEPPTKKQARGAIKGTRSAQRRQRKRTTSH